MSADMYTRPSREEIAEQVRSAQAAASEPEPQGSAVANFVVHLSARMRLLGWDGGDLAAKAGLHPKTVTRALNGNGIDMAGAERLAQALGGYLAAMVGPYVCRTCAGEPPQGFACLECAAEGSRG